MTAFYSHMTAFYSHMTAFYSHMTAFYSHMIAFYSHMTLIHGFVYKMRVTIIGMINYDMCFVMLHSTIKHE